MRSNFLIPDLIASDQIKGVYSHYDRMITLGAAPASEDIKLPNFHEFTKKENFLDRREIGIINIGGSGTISVDGKTYSMDNKD